ncbi:MAG: hypothetical protein KY455_12815 [Euryarchaeota archaeon]|nr:hypothetical protein [Euryarchaeota archaeon]
MGFSTIAASVVLFAALLFFGSTLTNSLFEAQRESQRALVEERSRAEFSRSVNITVDDGNHDNGKIYLNLTNTGSVALDGSKLHLLVDGAWKTDQITSRQVDGVTTDVWPTGKTLFLQASQSTAPGRVLVVAETGKYVYWSP